MSFLKITKKGSAKVETKKPDKRLMLLLGNEAKNHFLKGFRNNGGQTNASKGGWQPRKKQYHYEKIGAKWKKKSDIGKNILVQSGTLRRSITVTRVSNRQAFIGTKGVPYAKIHNEGLMGRAFGKYPFKMPKREFIGRSFELEQKIKRTIERYLKPTNK